MAAKLSDVNNGIVVVKIGGAAVDDRAAAYRLMRQVARCHESGMRMVLVHGGGARLTKLAADLGLNAHFVKGRRVTDDGLIEAAKMVFAGGVGSDLAAAAVRAGVPAVALSGVAAGLITVSKRPVRDGIDYGWVGDVERVEGLVLNVLLAGGLVPLVASLGVDQIGNIYNINADTVACALAVNLKAERLIMLTESDGVLRDVNDPKSRIRQLNAAALRAGNIDFAVSGGMLPKLESLAAAVTQGVGSVHVASWRQEDVLTTCLSSSANEIGTRIV